MEVLSIREQLALFGVGLLPAPAERGQLPACSLVVQASASTEDTLNAQQSSQAVVERDLLHSEPDLYSGKLKMEGRVKNALQYQLSYESPLAYV